MTSVYYTLAPIDFEMSQNKVPKMKLINYQGVSLYARQVNEQQYQVVQLCSSNLKDYLRTDIAPGSMIRFL